jgi:transposase
LPTRFHTPLGEALDPLLAEIESLTARIAEYDGRIEQIAKEVYPQVAVLRQVKGVGPLIALTFVLSLDDGRMATEAARLKSRDPQRGTTKLS